MRDYATTLRDRGLRATSPRVVLLKLVAEVDGHHHLTAQEIHDQACQTLPGLNLATVYRTLEWLHEVGLVDRLAAGLDQVHYSYRDPDHRHGHLCCKRCGKVSEFDYEVVENLAQLLEKKYGFSLADNHLGLSGICGDCQKAN